ncbi:ExeM/NucH family extracellular endonuclease [Herbiconiux moechotypicola]|nr:ExeM/NucH family extracellular endonuclease [Herbiconiux moechotypicola]MCS5729974.1 ExeM/NucH family extracellular endonuclease [Herbiconiux moechotypicola]
MQLPSRRPHLAVSASIAGGVLFAACLGAVAPASAAPLPGIAPAAAAAAPAAAVAAAGDTHTIAELQGTGDSSPFATDDEPEVTTSGIVTAAYPTGGFRGYTLQTPGTGGELDLAAHTASDGIFVYSSATVGEVEIGDYVQVTGVVSEYFGLTELTVGAGDAVVLDEEAEPVLPAEIVLPGDAAGRETLESMLLLPQGDFTVSNTYSTNQYAEIGLAVGDTPLITPTEIARPGTAAYDAAVADNAARAVTLDDGSSIDFLGADANKDIPLPYLTDVPTITVGSTATFTEPVVLDYRFSAWKFQPTSQLVAGGTLPAEFTDVRPAAPGEVGGDIRIAGFNVLNYFTTTGDSLEGCTFYTDRDGANVTVDDGCDARGAAEADDLERQQAKIVAAINGLGADVVSLEEIENSVKFGDDRDTSLAALVDALNAGLADGEDAWAYVASPEASALPDVEAQDVIRTAFIYKPSAVSPVGASRVLLDEAFDNARQPLAQEFEPAGGGDAFLAIVNHFKSKSSGEGADADQGDGQGGSNASRVAQANALLAFSDGLQTELGTTDVFLIGDFNAYTMEDPAVAITDAGYTDLGAGTGDDGAAEYSYSFSGQSGSLDHVYASPTAAEKVTGVDIWNINSGESIAKEYSRYNYNATDFYDESVYRSSDHDPVVVGYELTGTGPEEPGEPVTDRLSGADRYESAVAASLAGWPEGADTVYVVSGEVFPDALSAAPAAAAAGAPVLLVPQGGVPAAVQAELARLEPSSIVVVGGASSVSPAVADSLGLVAPVTRLEGADRYATSRAVAEAAFGADGAGVAVLAAGANFADALSAGAAVGSAGPVLLVDGAAGGLDDATVELLAALGADEIDIAGGPASVSDGILAEAGVIAPAERLGGADRYDSSRVITAHFFDAADRVLLATGLSFPDALAGSALAAHLGSPLLTVPGDCVPLETLDLIAELGAGQVTLLGGESTLTPAVAELDACGAVG